MCLVLQKLVVELIVVKKKKKKGFQGQLAAAYYSMLPHMEARTAAPMAAVSVILVDGAPLSWTGLHLSVEQQSSLVS